MTAIRILLPAALLASLPACQGTTTVVDQRPDHLPAEQLSSARWVSPQNEAGERSFASAIVVGPRHLVTNAHVWAESDPWWEAELAPERDLTLFDRSASWTIKEVEGDVTTMSSPEWYAPQKFRLVASGASTLEVGPDGEYTETSRNHGDWALVETDELTWDEGDLAYVHPPARDPDWRVPDGTELFVLGFSSIFKTAERGDPTGDGVTPATVFEPKPVASFIKAGPYTLKGHALLIDGLSTLTYTPGWPQPKGHSGGGVYLWNEEAERLELVGVFHSWMSFLMTRNAVIKPLGISALSFEWESEEQTRRLIYAPISGALQALSGGSN